MAREIGIRCYGLALLHVKNTRKKQMKVTLKRYTTDAENAVGDDAAICYDGKTDRDSNIKRVALQRPRAFGDDAIRLRDVSY